MMHFTLPDTTDSLGLSLSLHPSLILAPSIEFCSGRDSDNPVCTPLVFEMDMCNLEALCLHRHTPQTNTSRPGMLTRSEHELQRIKSLTASLEF